MAARRTIFGGLAASLFVLITNLGGSPAWALVDCNVPGQSISAAIEAGETEIEFIGACREYIDLQTDGISISGASGDRTRDVVEQGLYLRGAQNAYFRSFTILGGSGTSDGAVANYSDMVLDGLSADGNSKIEIEGSLILGDGVAASEGGYIYIQSTPIAGPNDGITVADGGQIYITSSDVTNLKYGVQVTRNSSFTMLAGRLGPALEDDGQRGCNPLCISNASSALIDGTVIEGSNNDPTIGGAVTVSRNSLLEVIGGATISNSGSQPAIGVYEASTLRQDRTNGPSGSQTGNLVVSGKSYADIRAGSLQGNIEVRLDSLLRLGAAGVGSAPDQIEITGDTTLAQDSHLVVEDPLVTINGDITCADRRSRLAGSFAGTGSVIRCRDFNNAKVAR